MDRIYLLNAKSAVPMPKQIAAGLEHGFKPAEMSSEFGNHRVYVDRQHAGEWLDKLIKNSGRGDTVYVYDLSLLGKSEAAIGAKLQAIAKAGLTVKVMAHKLDIKPTDSIAPLIEAMRLARREQSRKVIQAMNDAKKLKKATGGRGKSFNADEIELCRQAWLVSKTKDEVAMRATAFIKRPVSYVTIWRWAMGNPDSKGKLRWEPWPERGSGPKPTPKPRRKKRKAKR